MDDFFSILHSFKIGDLISVMPGLQHIYKERGIKARIYQRVGLPQFYDQENKVFVTDKSLSCMSENTFKLLKPLIEAQDYVESFRVWDGEKVNFNIDLSRDSKSIPLPSGMIHQWAWSLCPELSCDLSVPWIKSFPLGYCNTTDGVRQLKDAVIVNRTERYINPYIAYYFLQKYQDRIIFSGLPDEYKLFCDEWKLRIPLLITDDFAELARVINACKLYLGNASAGWHLADAQKIPRILELSTQYPNTFPTGANGHGFYHQRALEFYVGKMINQ